MTAASGPAVLVHALSYSIGARAIFKNFSFEQACGAHHLLIGPSGSGKTTLINLITGMLTPAAGRIEVAGEPMSDVPNAARDNLRRRRIGVIFQNLYLVSALSVRANLRLAQRLATGAIDDAAIDTLLDAVGMSHQAESAPNTLSQGEAQRAAIARALVGRPALVIADEPTSALDDVNAERIARLLIETAARAGSTLLIATHDARLRSFVPHILTLGQR